MSLQALIFDVDGTLAETEETHRKAFNRAFADAGLDWLWGRERYRELLAVSGGKERIGRFVEQEDPTQADRADFDEWVACLHRAKTIHYANMMAAREIELCPGVERLIREAHGDGLRLAIEDTRNGVLAASAAGIPALVTQSYYSEGEDFSGALAVLSDLGEPDYPYRVLAGIKPAPPQGLLQLGAVIIRQRC